MRLSFIDTQILVNQRKLGNPLIAMTKVILSVYMFTQKIKIFRFFNWMIFIA